MDRMTPQPRRSRPLALLAIAWAGVIFAMSSVPGSALPGGYSVQGHLTEYAVLGLLTLLALTRSGPERRTALIAFAICCVYAVTDEFHQSFVPGRMPDPLDWTADALGASVGVSAAVLWLSWRATEGSPCRGRKRP